MFCQKCGAKIPDQASFCRHCGAKQETTHKSEPEVPVVKKKPEKKTGKKRSRKKVKSPLKAVLLATGTLVLVLICVIGFFGFRKGHSKLGDDETSRIGETVDVAKNNPGGEKNADNENERNEKKDPKELKQPVEEDADAEHSKVGDVYEELIEKYRAVVVNQKDWNPDDALGDYYLIAGPHAEKSGYLLKDMNNDGLPELLIGSLEQSDWSTGAVYALYTCMNGEVIKVFESYERAMYRCLEDGSFSYSWSGSATDSGTDFYCMEKGAVDLSKAPMPSDSKPMELSFISFADTNTSGTGGEIILSDEQIEVLTNCAWGLARSLREGNFTQGQIRNRLLEDGDNYIILRQFLWHVFFPKVDEELTRNDSMLSTYGYCSLDGPDLFLRDILSIEVDFSRFPRDTGQELGGIGTLYEEGRLLFHVGGVGWPETYEYVSFEMVDDKKGVFTVRSDIAGEESGRVMLTLESSNNHYGFRISGCDIKFTY